jgi:AcrR family transcriptional regulator
MREQILAVAGELFHKRGYASVSLDDIIHARGITRAELQRHFSSKTALGAAWLERLARGTRLMQDDFMERPGEPAKRLRKYFMTMSHWMETHGFRSCQFANTAANIDVDEDPELAEALDQFKRAQRKFFIRLVSPLVPESQAQRAGTAVFLLHTGAMTEAQNLKATWPFEDALAAAEKLCGIEP